MKQSFPTAWLTGILLFCHLIFGQSVACRNIPLKSIGKVTQPIRVICFTVPLIRGDLRKSNEKCVRYSPISSTECGTSFHCMCFILLCLCFSRLSFSNLCAVFDLLLCAAINNKTNQNRNHSQQN